MFLDWIASHQRARARFDTQCGAGLYTLPCVDEWARSMLLGTDPPPDPRHVHDPPAERARRAVEMRPMSRYGACDERRFDAFEATSRGSGARSELDRVVRPCKSRRLADER